MPIKREDTRWNGWGWVKAHNPLEGKDSAWTWIAESLQVPALAHTPAKALSEVQVAPSRLGAEARTELVSGLGPDAVKDSLEERASHARGKSYLDLLYLRKGDLSAAPDAVVYPRTADEVVAQLRDGMTLGIGGWGSRRKPMALVHAIARSSLKDLTIVSYGGPAAYGIRIGHGTQPEPIEDVTISGGGTIDMNARNNAQPSGLVKDINACILVHGRVRRIRITGITINGVQALGANVDWATSNSATATAIAAQINSFGSTPVKASCI
jgi:hypothetical protein